MKKIRLAWLATHPIQYQVPLIKEISGDVEIDLTVLYFSDFSSRTYIDREFGRQVKWDLPLLEGYKYKFIGDQSESSNGVTFFSPKVKGLEELLTRENFDVILIQGWNHYAYVKAAWLAKKAGLKVLLRCEATDHVSSSRGLIKFIRERIVKFLFARVDYFMAIGSRNLEFYKKRNIKPERIGSMPYCVDNIYFRNKAKEADLGALRNKINLKNDRPVILYASKLTARKHADLLLEAYISLNEPKPNLIFVGDGELLEVLKIKTEESKLENVYFTGFCNQSELPAYYSLADIFVLPSVNETWGLVVNEAMNAGCAIVVTEQVGSGADLVINGKNGFVVEADSIPALVNALSALLKNKTYLKMKQHSIDLISNWGIESNLTGLKKILTKL